MLPVPAGNRPTPTSLRSSALNAAVPQYINILPRGLKAVEDSLLTALSFWGVGVVEGEGRSDNQAILCKRLQDP